MMTRSEYKLDGGCIVPIDNTPLGQIKYGEQQWLKINGKRVKRNYEELYCDFCGNQILARYVKASPHSPHKYHLISTTNFNRLSFCCPECAKRKGDGKARKLEGTILGKRERVINDFLYGGCHAN